VLPPLHLTPEQLKSLRRQQRRAIGRVAERIHYVMLFARGYPIDQIATLYQVDARTVLSWLERYRSLGVEGLDDLPRSGRPRRASVAACAEARCCLDASPDQVGALRATWTRRLLQRHLLERLGVRLSLRTLGRMVATLGFVFARPKLTVKPLPEGEEERAGTRAIIATARALFPHAPCLFGDECDVHLVPVVRGTYQRRGEQREIPTPGSNRKQPVFGFLNGATGQWHYFLTQRKRSVEFVTCLWELEREYPEGPILLFVDHGSIHKSELTLRWLARHPRIVLIYLPAYSGHKSNPVEKVWWALKEEVAANQLYASIEGVQDAIIGFFAQFSREAALRLTARYVPEPQLFADWPVTKPAAEPLPLAA
jgi:putative transposase